MSWSFVYETDLAFPLPSSSSSGFPSRVRATLDFPTPVSPRSTILGVANLELQWSRQGCHPSMGVYSTKKSLFCLGPWDANPYPA